MEIPEADISGAGGRYIAEPKGRDYERIRAAGIAMKWMVNVSQFRAVEVVRRDTGTFESAKAEHRITLASLVANGEVIHRMILKGAPVPIMGFSSDDFEATLSMLRETQCLEYGHPANPDRKNSVKALLGVT